MNPPTESSFDFSILMRAVRSRYTQKLELGWIQEKRKENDNDNFQLVHLVPLEYRNIDFLLPRKLPGTTVIGIGVVGVGVVDPNVGYDTKNFNFNLSRRKELNFWSVQRTDTHTLIHANTTLIQTEFSG